MFASSRARRHRRLLEPHDQPLWPSPALLAGKLWTDCTVRRVPVCTQATPQPAHGPDALTEGGQGEGLGVSQGAEDEGLSQRLVGAMISCHDFLSLEIMEPPISHR